MDVKDLLLLVASRKPSHYTSAHAVRLSRCHRHPCHQQFQSIAYTCLLAGLFAVQEMAKTGQRLPVASGGHPSCFQKVIREAFVCLKITAHYEHCSKTSRVTYWGWNFFRRDARRSEGIVIICGYCLFSFLRTRIYSSLQRSTFTASPSSPFYFRKPCNIPVAGLCIDSSQKYEKERVFYARIIWLFSSFAFAKAT